MNGPVFNQAVKVFKGNIAEYTYEEAIMDYPIMMMLRLSIIGFQHLTNSLSRNGLVKFTPTFQDGSIGDMIQEFCEPNRPCDCLLN
jgi:hypothetical protein